MERTRNRNTVSTTTLTNLKRLRLVKGRLATVNLVPGQRVVDEELYPGAVELREWKPHTSKIAAAITKGLVLTLPPEPIILYLGAASGTSVSYLSDLFPNGRIYAVEFSRDPIIDLVLLSETRPNIIPILADARHPETYASSIPPADLVFQDIAQRDQIPIFLDNCLLSTARAPLLIAVKSRSIDVAAPVAKVAKAARAQLSERLLIEQELRLEPYEKDHIFFRCSWPEQR